MIWLSLPVLLTVVNLTTIVLSFWLPTSQLLALDVCLRDAFA
nr:DUF645 family protein [Vibrio cholerae]